MDDEQLMWEGHSSHLINLATYVWCSLVTITMLAAAFILRNRLDTLVLWILFFVAFIPVIYGLIKWLQNKTYRYQLTSERLRISSGILSRTTDEIELYRAKDYSLVEPFWLRLVGLGTVVVHTNDDSNPVIEIRAVPQASELRDLVRKYVEQCREKKGSRVTEFES